jgi:hypothetical protein
MDGFDWPYPIKARWSINPCVTQERGGGEGEEEEGILIGSVAGPVSPGRGSSPAPHCIISALCLRSGLMWLPVSACSPIHQSSPLSSAKQLNYLLFFVCLYWPRD